MNIDASRILYNYLNLLYWLFLNMSIDGSIFFVKNKLKIHINRNPKINH